MHYLDSYVTHREKVIWELYKNARCYFEQIWMQRLTKQQLYDLLPSISQTIPLRPSRHAGHRWRSKDDLISDILLRTLAYKY